MTWLPVDREATGSPRVQAALVALVIAMLLVLAATARAVRIAPPASTSTAAAEREGNAPVLARAVQVDAEQVVQNDIFAADRRAPPERYPMPGEYRDTGPAVARTALSARPAVLGTAVGIDGEAFATVQVPRTAPRIVRVGDMVGSYTVVAITRGTVTFRAADAAPFQVHAL